MKKGILRINVPGYDPERAAGKPYQTPTYSRQRDASRISIKDQAREYALWLMKEGRTHCHLYPMSKSNRGGGVSAEFRRYLLGFHRGPLEITEVDPKEFLGGLKS